MVRLLMIDDDVELCQLLTEYLGREGLDLSCVHDGPAGLDRAVGGGVDLVILDVMLPGLGGLDLLRALRQRSMLPVLMLTARGDDIDRVVGLELGADDYLPKPFNPRELLARIRAILRRAHRALEEPVREGASLRLGSLQIEMASHAAWDGGRRLALTELELRLLEQLLRRVGEALTREELAERLLGRSWTPFDRSIDVHISSLRRKLGPWPGGAERILSVRGVGYMLLPPGS